VGYLIAEKCVTALLLGGARSTGLAGMNVMGWAAAGVTRQALESEQWWCNSRGKGGIGLRSVAASGSPLGA
jgi:hypothetical protein